MNPLRSSVVVFAALALGIAAGAAPQPLAKAAELGPKPSARTTCASPGSIEVELELHDACPGGVAYDVYHQVHVPTFANSIVAAIERAINQETARKNPDESDADFAIRKQFAQHLRSVLTAAVRQTDDVSLGWKLDRTARRSCLDLSIAATSGTPLAERFAKTKGLPTAFAGFQVPGAALTARWVGQTPRDEAAAAAKIVRMVRENELKKIDREGFSDDEKRDRKEAVNRLFDVAEATVSSGRIDGGVSLVAQPDRVTLVAAGYVAEGLKLHGVVKSVLQVVEPYVGGFVTLKIDAEQYEGVHLHTASIPAPSDAEREKFVKLFGESLEVVLGFGKEAVYVAAGRDAMKALKGAIHKSATPVVPASPLEVSLALKPVADFLAEMGQEHEKAPARFAAGMLALAPGKDHVRLTADVKGRSVTLRLEAEQGILDLLAAVSPEFKQFLSDK